MDPAEYQYLLSRYGTSKNGHSLFAPSASYGWLYCAGYLLANAVAADDAGIEAAYGTVAHHVAERWNKLGAKPVALLNTVESASAGGNNFRITIDQAMLEFVEEYVNWCAELPGDHYFERRVDLSPVMPIPNQGGTADHFACEPGRLTITDLKMGTGVRVYAENNPQAMLYALGVFFEWDWIYGFQTIIIRICQPRLDVFETWECSRADLLAFADFVTLRAGLAWQLDAARTPGQKQCRFCAVKRTCLARLLHIDGILDNIFGTEEFDDNDLAEVTSRDYTPALIDEAVLQELPGMNAAYTNRARFKTLSTHALSYVLTHRRHIELLFKDMAEELLRRAEAGEQLPYQKLADGRKKRIWTNKDTVAVSIATGTGIEPLKIAPPTVLSPSKMEKLIRAELQWKPAEIKKWLDDHAGISVMSGKRTLTDLRDDRPDAYDLAESMFEAEEDDEDDL
jgi:hypothetical protein